MSKKIPKISHKRAILTDCIIGVRVGNDADGSSEGLSAGCEWIRLIEYGNAIRDCKSDNQKSKFRTLSIGFWEGD